jgi:hypothetical protein
VKWGADEVRRHESTGLFLPSHLYDFHKKLDKDFFVFIQQIPHAFGMALLVAASSPVRKRRCSVIRAALRSPKRHVGDVRVGIAVDRNFFVFDKPV